jgi:hypothetical protein
LNLKKEGTKLILENIINIKKLFKRSFFIRNDLDIHEHLFEVRSRGIIKIKEFFNLDDI